jgi:hypothetical protein
MSKKARGDTKSSGKNECAFVDYEFNILLYTSAVAGAFSLIICAACTWPYSIRPVVLASLHLDVRTFHKHFSSVIRTEYAPSLFTMAVRVQSQQSGMLDAITHIRATARQAWHILGEHARHNTLYNTDYVDSIFGDHRRRRQIGLNCR